MSSIWNPQDRFILSNMTSEKLYAKSPLTTGVSGTSAYIGLEPSATYNETVLWSGSTAKSGTLSEYVSAFDYVKFYCTDDAKNSFVITMDGTCSAAGNTLILTPNSGGATYRTLNAEVTGKDFAIWGSQFGFNGSTTAIGWVNGRTSNNTWTLATKVVGINRKEV